jgi:tetratricopeptide (TPR) repeat protein
MTAAQAHPEVQQAVAQAQQALQRGDIAAAEQVLAPLFGRDQAGDPAVLQLAGLVRLQQRRFPEAAALFAAGRGIDPRDPYLAYYHGSSLAAQAQFEEAFTAWRTALALKPDLAEAYQEMGAAQKNTGQLDDAEKTYRQMLRVLPGNAAAKLSLSALLIDAGRPAEAETIARGGLNDPMDPRLKGVMHNNLALALRAQHKNAEALENYEKAQALDPTLPLLDMLRAEVLHDLKRYDEALDVFRNLVAKEPEIPRWHHNYNELLYRMNRTEDCLKSYDRAPRTRDLLLDKAYFLSHERRGEEVHELYSKLLARDPGDVIAATGVANALVMMKRYDEAAAAFDATLVRPVDNPDIYSCAAEVAILRDDPQKAVALCRQALALEPYHQSSLANMGVGLRMIGDEHEYLLNGYDSLVQVFDLEPPPGFSSMESFNLELCTYLDRIHPQTREYLNQTLRTGTQTPGQLFGTGHVLVDKIQMRINQAVGRYIAGLREDDKHPFLSRRGRGFTYAGSWSSRLADCGFHINHVHPKGWISSCYYVGVPDAVQDAQRRQGWIKFGESGFDHLLERNPARRAVQPVPGRLVLFPSYMWHGTVPFRSPTPRTTIAFDVVST